MQIILFIIQIILAIATIGGVIIAGIRLYIYLKDRKTKERKIVEPSSKEIQEYGFRLILPLFILTILMLILSLFLKK